MLKKLISHVFAAVAALTLMFSPAEDAAAWDRVCLKLPLWHVIFKANFYLVYGFDKTPGKVPATFASGRRRIKLPNFGEHTDENGRPAEGRKDTGNFAVNGRRCLSLSHIPAGEPFFVYIKPEASWRSVRCQNHHTNPNPWYAQKNRPQGTLEYEAWGTVNNAGCAFRRESR